MQEGYVLTVSRLPLKPMRRVLVSDEIIEPLTGRKYEFQLYPMSLIEIKNYFSSLEIKRILENRIIMGMYPEIIQKPNEADLLLKTLLI